MHAALVSNFLTGLQDMLNVAHEVFPNVASTINPSLKPRTRKGTISCLFSVKPCLRRFPFQQPLHLPLVFPFSVSIYERLHERIIEGRRIDNLIVRPNPSLY